jgi:uncharacterized protein
MIQQLKDRQPEIARLCEEYSVRKLEVFGSAATGDFAPDRSDFDFVIDFLDYGPGIVDRFTGLADALETLLGSSVDLVVDRAMKPRFRNYIADTREVVFERDHRPVAA